jgi:hypothetical protein
MNRRLNVGMSYDEISKAESYINGKTKMLEWGCGGSTLYFPELVDQYVSIEHDEKWYNKIKQDVPNNVEFYHIPINKDMQFDDDLDANASDILSGNSNWNTLHGCNELTQSNGKTFWTTRGKFDWHCAIDYIKKPLELSHRNYDIILVDGRCRAMCGYIAKYLIKEGGHVLFHDFNNREYYHGILKYYTIVDTEESLAVLQKK